MIEPDQGPFSRYNARRLTPEQVARDFVAPDTYWTLVETVDPQLLIGPRGIGKTTLLKMLLPEAVDAWLCTQDNARRKDAERARSSIGFTGVFVAADKLWSGQVSQMTASIIEMHRPRFGRAAFAFMALAAFAETAAYRCRLDGDRSMCRWTTLSRGNEEALVSRIAPAWLAHPATSSLEGLADQMQANLAELGQVMQLAAAPDLSEAELAEINRHRLLSIDFFTAAVRFLDGFNRAVDERHAPWILLIDEFEFLPPWTRIELGDAFQGKDVRLSYKLSIAPYTGLDPFTGTPLNDWHKVSLTQPTMDQGYTFGKELFARQIGGSVPPEQLFKGGGFEPQGRDNYGPESKNAEDIKSLARFDEGFRAWCEQTLGKSGTDGLEEAGLYDLIRKAMPLVRLRLEYRKEGEDLQAAGRSRHRIPEIYGGAENIYALAEGNPRWIKALAHALREGHEGASTIPADHQARAIEGVSWELFNNLKAVPIEKRTRGEHSLGEEGDEPPMLDSPYGELTPFGLMETLGEYLEQRVHGSKFAPDVPGTFIVDDQDIWLADVLNSLIFLGSLIVESAEGGDRDRIRLAHMWAPIFRLLPRKGTPRSLRGALKPAPRSRRSTAKAIPGQQTLSIGDEET